MSSAATQSKPVPCRVIVGVGAGIAAYKVAHLVRGLRKAGHQVFVIPTPASLEFVGAQTWQELSENPVGTDVFHKSPAPGHVALARDADLIMVAPCTADLLAKLRVGIADSLLTTTVLASAAPLLLAPAMHTQMWRAAATQENVAVLRSRGITVLEPASGALSSGDSGVGRLPEPDVLLAAAEEALAGMDHADASERPLAGKRVLVSAGGTHEPLDPVRFLGNYSTGRQGIELARMAAELGAEVVLVTGAVSVPVPAHGAIRRVEATSAREMADAMLSELPGTDAVFMTAAVADYRPADIATQKLKKETWGDSPTIALQRNPDILRAIAADPARPPLVVGFAAETGSAEQVLEFGRAKAQSKGADYIAINRVGDGAGFGDVENELTLVDGQGVLVRRAAGTKAHLARELLRLLD